MEMLLLLCTGQQQRLVAFIYYSSSRENDQLTNFVDNVDIFVFMRIRNSFELCNGEV